MRISVNRNLFFANISIATLVVISVITNRSYSTCVFISYVIMLLSVYFSIKMRKNWYSFLISLFILWFNYSICISNYISPFEDWFTRYNHSISFMIPVMNILLIFIAVLVICSPTMKENSSIDFKLRTPSNNLVVLSIMLVLILIFLFGFSRNNIGERGGTTTAYEYSIVLFILAFLYCRNKIAYSLTSFILLLYVVNDLVFGNRATALQLITCWFLIFMSNRVSIFKMIPFGICGVFIMSSVSLIRANIIAGFSISGIVADLLEKKLSLDTAYSAFFTSTTFFRTEGLVSISTRLKMFVKFIQLQFLGGSVIKDADLSLYTHNFFEHWFGGVLPYYFHFYLGYVGVIIIGIYISFLIRKVCVQTNIESSKSFLKCASVYFVSTTPRWYLYSPAPLFRGFMILFIAFQFTKVIDAVTSSKKV